ncbi:MAG TPA: MATE family efflux transporter [bacterium]|nr:MATE family efflux transporter [bacterium]HPG44125.1 MATE family efflux transporter [bacterium]HPM96492.1 MATE family efflux transporter [bacterium]
MKHDDKNQSRPGEPAFFEWQAKPELLPSIPLDIDTAALTRMPLVRAIFTLALPASLSMLFLMIFNLVDIWWVGKLGSDYLAGVSAAAFILWALDAIGALISTGVTALVARSVGETNLQKGNQIARQGFWLSLAIGALFAVGGILFSAQTFRLIGLQGRVYDAAVDYMNWIIPGLPAIFLSYMIESVFRGSGDTRTPLKIMSMALLLNAALDPLLIFGWGFFPALEAGGAGLATVLAHVFVSILGWRLLAHRPISLHPMQSPLLSPSLMWRICRVGIPISLNGLMFSFSYMALTGMIVDFGPGALAALGLGHRIEGIPYLASMGFAVAAQTLIGQNLGAKKPDRAENSVWLTVLFVSAFLAVISLCFYLFAEPIFRFFTTDESVLQEGVRYLKTIAVFELFLGFEIVLEGAFSGSGNSLPAMLVVVPLTWARIPLGIFLSKNCGMGSAGIWWAISSTTAVKGILLAFWFRLGRWKNHAV